MIITKDNGKKMLTFTVDGETQAKQRPRGTKDGHFYTPKKTVDYEEKVKRAYIGNFGKTQISGAIRAYITAFFTPPKSLSRKKREKLIKDEALATKKPDCDNIAKSVLDALNEVAYKDDSQVTDLYIRKRYGDTAKVVIALEEMGGNDK